MISLCTQKHGRSTYYTSGWFSKNFAKWDSTLKLASVHGERHMLPAASKLKVSQVGGEIKYPQATGLDLSSDLEILDLVEGSEEDEDK